MFQNNNIRTLTVSLLTESSPSLVFFFFFCLLFHFYHFYFYSWSSNHSCLSKQKKNKVILPWDYSFSTYAKFSEELIFFATRTCVYQGEKNVIFLENCMYFLHESPSSLCYPHHYPTAISNTTQYTQDVN